MLPSVELPTIRAEWKSLCIGQSLLPVFDPEFFELLLAYFGEGGERIVACSEGDRTVAIGIVRPVGRFAWETFQPSQAPVSAWIADASMEFEPLARSIIRRLPGLCLQIGLTQLDPLASIRPDVRGVTRTLDYIDIARMELHGDFEAYWSARGKNLRQNLQKQRNRLDRDGLVVRVELLSRASEMSEGVNRYSDMESKGWKSEGGTALVRGGAQAQFYEALMQHYAAAGEARIYQLFFGDRLVAIDLGVCRKGTLIILKTTHDESLSQMSPSMLLKQEIIRSGYQSGDIHCIEFYGKAMDWHRRLTDDIRRMYHVNVFRNRLVSWLHDMRAQRSAQSSSSDGTMRSAEASEDLKAP